MPSFERPGYKSQSLRGQRYNRDTQQGAPPEGQDTQQEAPRLGRDTQQEAPRLGRDTQQEAPRRHVSGNVFPSKERQAASTDSVRTKQVNEGLTAAEASLAELINDSAAAQQKVSKLCSDLRILLNAVFKYFDDLERSNVSIGDHRVDKESIAALSHIWYGVCAFLDLPDNAETLEKTGISVENIVHAASSQAATKYVKKYIRSLQRDLRDISPSDPTAPSRVREHAPKVIRVGQATAAGTLGLSIASVIFTGGSILQRWQRQGSLF